MNNSCVCYYLNEMILLKLSIHYPCTVLFYTLSINCLIFQSDLRDILRAYALRNPALGYTQGMGMVAGMLLMYMTPEHAFWVFCVLLETVLNI
jgi:hypothetical protein